MFTLCGGPLPYGRGSELAPFRKLRLCSGRCRTATVRERADIAPSPLPYGRGSEGSTALKALPLKIQ